jgi:hypothetical protein
VPIDGIPSQSPQLLLLRSVSDRQWSKCHEPNQFGAVHGPDGLRSPSVLILKARTMLSAVVSCSQQTLVDHYEKLSSHLCPRGTWHMSRAGV